MRYIRQFAVFLVLLIACGFLLYSVYTDIESKTITQVNNEQLVHAGQAAAGIEHFFCHIMTLSRFLQKMSTS
jgi:hypothetical protein